MYLEVNYSCVLRWAGAGGGAAWEVVGGIPVISAHGGKSPFVALAG